MNRKRRTRIEDLLLRGGAIHRRREDDTYTYALIHPSDEIALKDNEVMELLDEGSLVVITCGCNGFWWALRPDLVAMRSARTRLSKVAA